MRDVFLLVLVCLHWGASFPLEGSEACNNDCSKVLKPVCGSDGVTYSNECFLNYEICSSGSAIDIVSRGSCPGSSDVSDTPDETTMIPEELENGEEQHDNQGDCDPNCLKIYKPICGSDGETYSNECELNLAACRKQDTLVKVTDGECPESTTEEDLIGTMPPELETPSDCESNCSAIYAPICGSDNVTYSSWCHLKEAECLSGAKIFEISQGPCQEPSTEALNAEDDECPDRCQSAFKLVCGSDGNTYSSECSLREFACKLQQNVTWVHDGPCPRNSTTHHGHEDESGCNCTVSFKYAPVCGTNNQTYPEECILRKEACAKNDESLVVKYLGVCAEDTRCARSCRQDFEPVCGSDGATYSNRCTLESEACQQDKDITVLYEGVCGRDTEECPKTCMAVFEPVCGSDNQTYANECELRVTACKEKSNLTLGYDGSCEMRITRNSEGEGTEMKNCPDICPLIFKPTCGTDGLTYDNECKLRSAACFSKTNITVKHEGSCITFPDFQPIETENGECNFSCQDVTTIPVPVCSSNNETYGSECEMRKEACLQNITLTVQSEGTCDQPHVQAYDTLNIERICPVICPAIFKPVCGSDGKSYNNECRLEMVQCDRNRSLVKVSDGLCEEKEKYDALPVESKSATVYSGNCHLKCTNELRPVCGSNGKTYSNKCLLEMFNCENGESVTIAFENDCNSPPFAALEQDDEISSCQLSCSAEDLNPICGTDGRTYSNECFMKRWSCQSNKPIYVSYSGPCASDPVPEIIFAGLETEEQFIEDCNLRCTNEYRPVCGNNGQTYDNPCHLDQTNCLEGTNVGIAFQGDCSSPPLAALETDQGSCVESCPSESKPVCGTDGLTYTNECFLLKKACEEGINLWVSYPSPCGTLFKSADILGKCPTGCSKIKKPVCGNDGLTYENACLLKMHNCQHGTEIKVQFAGDCASLSTLDLMEDCRATCSGINHVCGSNGLTFDNECSLKKWACLQNETILVAHASPCKRDDLLQPIECPQECSDEEDQVCGSDGESYLNECKLREKACSQDTALRVLIPGNCPLLEEVFCALQECPNYFKPVCGSNNITYENECHFYKNNTCGDVKTGVTITARDFCEVPMLNLKDDSDEECLYDCAEIDSPICGSDNRTYLNECFLKAHACQTKTPTTILHMGECELTARNDNIPIEEGCPVICPAIFAPVCGSDNNTYDNECSLKVKACLDKTNVSVISSGRCKSEEAEVVEKCPQICPTIYAPVCGTDLKSYPNECHLKAKACRDKSDVTVASNGECPSMSEDEDCPVLCPAIYAPVCGSDDKTYPSECNLKAKACMEKSGVVIAFIGECPMMEDPLADKCPAFCPAIYAPVCGSDGQTYPSKCNFMAKACEAKSDLTVVSFGECPDPQVKTPILDCPAFCPAIYAPVCGSDNQTYPSECNLKALACIEKTNVTIVSSGKCSESEIDQDCPSDCPEIFSPVCGTDNNTYSDECSLKAKSCSDKTNVTAAYPGTCIDQDASSPQNNCPLQCPDTNFPVCGSDNKTYANECALKMEVCQNTSLNLTIAFIGECPNSVVEEIKEDCPIFCPAIYAPVCGSDNHSYPNECSFKAKVCSEKLALTILYNGECKDTVVRSGEECPVKCETIFAPVCGSDGKTYTNECTLKAQACVAKTDVIVASPGLCDQDMLAASEEDCPIICPTLLAPVCGSDGKTYPNECSLEAQACIEKSGVTTDHVGPCLEMMATEETKCTLECPDISAPVCGSDGETYANTCALESKNCELETEILVSHDGQCLKDIFENPTQECPLVCPAIDAPVCGSDGETYSNECTLKFKACKELSKLTTAHIGMCLKDIVKATSDDCPLVCPAIEAPVCGSDGESYKSECALKAKACAEKSGLSVAYAGACLMDIENQPEQKILFPS